MAELKVSRTPPPLTVSRRLGKGRFEPKNSQLFRSALFWRVGKWELPLVPILEILTPVGVDGLALKVSALCRMQGSLAINALWFSSSATSKDSDDACDTANAWCA